MATFLLLTPYLDASMLSIRASVRQMPDEGTILSNADRVSRGHALYREVFDFKGPISYLPYVLADRVAAPTARNGRLTMFIILSFWAAAMFELARRITGRRVVAGIVALWVPLQIWQAWTYAYQDFTAQLLLVLGVLAALWSFEADAAGPEATTEGWRPSTARVAAGTCSALALWTSLAQGLTGLVALGSAVGLVAGVSRGRRAGLTAGGAFAVGVMLGSAGVFVWLARMGAVRAGLEAMLLFPFQHYRSPTNVTTYGFDAPIYAGLWESPRWLSASVQAMLLATEVVPIVALVVALPVMSWLLVLVARPHLRRGWPSDLVARVALPASLAATAVPVALNRTRSDICHLGFVEGGCVIATLAVFALRSRPGPRGRALAVGRGILTAGLGATALMAAAFYANALRIKPPGYVDLDVEGRIVFDGDLIAARTQPGDRIVVTGYGGWQYLYSRRDNATSFALLLDDSYSAEEWPVAARQIVANRPRLLLAPEDDFKKLCGYEAAIAAMYFGYDGNYMLDERGAGPPFPLPAPWELEGPGIFGTSAGSMQMTLREDGGSARLLAFIPARQAEMRAVLHGDRLSVFEGSLSYVGTLSADGSRIRGVTFGQQGERRAFTGHRLAPSGPTP